MVGLNALVPWRNNKADTPAKREDFFDPLVTFRREMDRMFDHFFDGIPMRSAAGWSSLTPAVDIGETDQEMVITAELPGVSDKDVEVSLAGDVLTIKGEKKAETEHKNGDSTYVERRFGAFSTPAVRGQGWGGRRQIQGRRADRSAPQASGSTAHCAQDRRQDRLADRVVRSVSHNLLCYRTRHPPRVGWMSSLLKVAGENWSTGRAQLVETESRTQL